ncbi:MAG: SDR family NAD(P)-dependent oxidoreductase [Firmicutes bacterium]|nr:SDR family NAD(P)-dependent oxidoreductase [Bacillota bacterium]MCL1953940.1 SDR family NAD(P)-dependent oxidoreductase [Bacillota bacterium]
MKYTVITGASSGIGYESAIAFAKRGHNLVIVARRENELNKLRQQIIEINDKLSVLVKVVDLSNIDNVYKFYDSLKDIEIDIFVNNAGFGDRALVGEADLNKINTMLSLNVTALTILSNLFIRDYKDKSSTQLINVSSFVGYHILSSNAVYCATKFFVSSFTEILAQELRDNKNKCKAKVLAPAVTETEFSQVAADVKEFSYKQNLSKYHTAKEMAEFLMQLVDSDKVLGIVDINTYKFVLRDGQCPLAP